MQDKFIRQAPPDEDADGAFASFDVDGQGRVELKTIHGSVYIDIRRDDVNAYVLNGLRVDHLLIPKRT